MPPTESTGATCLKVFAALALGGIAVVAGLMGACFALFGVQGGANGGGGVDAQFLGIAVVCSVVLAGCIAGLVAIFRKRS